MKTNVYKDKVTREENAAAVQCTLFVEYFCLS